MSRKVWESGPMKCYSIDFSRGLVELFEPSVEVGDGSCDSAALESFALCDLTVSARLRYRVVLEELSDEEAGHAEG